MVGFEILYNPDSNLFLKDFDSVLQVWFYFRGSGHQSYHKNYNSATLLNYKKRSMSTQYVTDHLSAHASFLFIKPNASRISSEEKTKTSKVITQVVCCKHSSQFTTELPGSTLSYILNRFFPPNEWLWSSGKTVNFLQPVYSSDCSSLVSRPGVVLNDDCFRLEDYQPIRA